MRSLPLFALLAPPPPASPPFPYTTLFRSVLHDRYLLAPRNSARLPGYQRIDVALRRTWGRPTAAQWSASLQVVDRKSTRLNSSHLVISYAVFCLKKKNNRLGTIRNEAG